MQLRFTLIDFTGGTPVSTIVADPIGWDSLTLKLERDKEYHGFLDYQDDEVSGLKFYDTAHAILKSAFNNVGIDARVDLRIEIYCNPQWNELFYGRVDFDRTQFECGLNGCFAETAVTKNNCLAQFLNRKDQNIDLDTELTFDGTALTPYDKLGFDLNLPGKKVKFAFSGQAENIVHKYYDFKTEPPTAGFDSQPGYSPVRVNKYQHYFQFETPVVTGSSLSLINNASYNYHVESDPDIPNLWFKDYPGVYTYQRFSNLLCSNKIVINFTANGYFRDNCYETRFYDTFAAIVKVPLNGPPEALAVHPIHSCSGCYAPVNKYFSFPLTAITEMEPGDRIFCHFHVKDYQYTTSGTDGDIHPSDVTKITWDIAQLFIDISSDSKCEDSTTKAYMINEALSRSAEVYSNDCLRVFSNYFGRTDAQPYSSEIDGCAGFTSITNGRLIRQGQMKVGSPPKMFVNFKDMMESLNAIHCIGYGLENDPHRTYPDGTPYKLLRVEPFEYFYRKTVVFNCPNVPILKSVIAAEMFVSKYTTGYSKWEAEEVGGQDDFHGRREYRLAISSINNEFQKISNFIASGYSIEVTRRQFGSNDKDWRYDDNIFVFCLRRDGVTQVVDIPNIITTAGNYANIYDPDTTYNIFISPARMAMRWVKKIAQSLLPNWAAGSILKFTAGQGNYVAKALQTNYNGCRIEGGPLTENQDISNGDFQDSAFAQPIMYNILDEFEYPLSYTDYVAITANPYGLIQYSCNNGQTLSGFIKTISYKPTDGKATFQLIRAYLP